METLHVGYAAAGGVAVLMIMASKQIRRLPLTEPMAGLLIGVLLGPSVLGALVVPDDARTTLLLESARILLAISLIGVGLRFPVRHVRAVARPVAVLVGIGMPVLAAVTGALAAWLLGLPWALAALLGACLSPTDPVLASGVVTGTPAARDLPDRLRQVITEESGSNDGLALPLVLLALAPVLGHGLAGQAVEGLRQVVVASVVAAAIGYAVGRAVRALERGDDVEGPPELLITLLMAVAVLGAARLLDSDGVLAVFVSALAFNAAVGERELRRQVELDEAFNRYLVIPVFVLVGATLPLSAWGDLGWGGVAFAAAVLLLRRPPAVLLLRRPAGLSRLDAGFAGWFGPIGVSALFYVALAEHEGVTDPRLFAAGTLALAVSTVAHGVTTLPGRRLYHRLTGGGDGDPDGDEGSAPLGVTGQLPRRPGGG